MGLFFVMQAVSLKRILLLFLCGLFLAALFRLIDNAIGLRDGEFELLGKGRSRGAGLIGFDDFLVPFVVLGDNGLNSVFLAQLMDRLAGDAELFTDFCIGFQLLLKFD